MGPIVGSINQTSKFSKLIYWGKLVSITGSAQVIVQAIGLISGILIIRLLPTKEYALYTLVNTMLGTMTILTDGGIGAGVMAQGGKVWQNRDQLGQVLTTGLDLRRKFAIGSLAVAVPILLYLLLHHNAGWIKAIIIVLSLIPAFIAALSDSLLEVGLKLHQDIKALQKNQVWVNILRLIFIGLVFMSPFAAIAIIAAGIPRIWGNIKLRKLSYKYANWNEKPNPVIRKDILLVVKRILPGSIYFCFSSQLTVWLMSVFGATSSVAQIGALSRLSLMLNVIGTVFSTLIIPRFARMTNDKGGLLKKYVFIILAITIVNAFILLLVWLFPTYILWVLGNKYSNLNKELFLSVAGSCLVLISGVSYSLYTNRGWVINPIIAIPINILIIIVGLLLINIRTLTGVLMFNLFIEIINVLINVIFGLFKIMKLKE